MTRSLRSGMIPLIDSDQDHRRGVLPRHDGRACCWRGADPVDAVRLQLVLLWALLGSVAISSLMATSLGYRGFFTPAHQLRESVLEDV